jgi:hypothetical protein
MRVKLQALLGALLLWALALALVSALTGCVLSVVNRGMPERKVVRGTLIYIERVTDYEAPCNLKARIHKACDEPPVCCSYQAALVDDDGRKHWFFFFAPRKNKIPRIGKYGRWVLHSRSIVRFVACSPFGCPSDVAYALDSDEDWERDDERY